MKYDCLIFFICMELGMLELINNFIEVFRKTYIKELYELQQKRDKALAEKIHEYRFFNDTKYREDIILKNARAICKRLESNGN